MRIDAVELAVLKLPLVKSFETSFGRMTSREFVLVTMRTDDIAGFGECVADAEIIGEPAFEAGDGLTRGEHRPAQDLRDGFDFSRAEVVHVEGN